MPKTTMKQGTTRWGAHPLPVGKQHWQTLISTLLLLVIATSLSSCQTIKRYQCNSEDWAEVGMRDGQAGRVPEIEFTKYEYDCSASGAIIDQSAYMTGHQQGLGEFCTYQRAETQASTGYKNAGLCTEQFGPDFDQGYLAGLEQLCTTSGGQALAKRGHQYRGTCPPANQEEFLASYITTLEVLLPQAVADVTIREIKTTTLQSNIRGMESDEYMFDSAIEVAILNSNGDLLKRLQSEQFEVSARLRRLKREQRQERDMMRKARKRSESIEEMLLQWKPELEKFSKKTADSQ